MDGEARWAAVHGVTRSPTRLSGLTFTFHFHALEKEMATHSRVLAWRSSNGGAWWAPIYGVAQSRTRLKWLSSSSRLLMFHLRNLTSAALPDLPLHILTLEARSSHSVCIHGESQAISKIFFVVTWSIYFCFIGYTKAFDCVDHNKLWKILKEMAIPDHQTCLLRNLYAGQETTVATGHGTRLVSNRERSTSRL